MRPSEQLLSPYPLYVIEGFLSSKELATIERAFPDRNSPLWIGYNNPLERKKALADLSKLPPCFEELFNRLNGQMFVKELEALTGLKNLIPDQTLNGGGLHLHTAGQHLDVHLDYSHQINTGLKRVLNLIIYIPNMEWKEGYGGQLQVYDGIDETGERASHLVASYSPKRNRAVIFATSGSVHGVSPIATGNKELDIEIERRSIAVYYYQNDGRGAGESQRTGTKFLARPGEPLTEESVELRRLRGISSSSLATKLPRTE